MVDTGFGAGMSPAQLQTLLANDMPLPEATSAIDGSSLGASRSDHRHPRLTSTSVLTIDANGERTITFTRSFSSMPTLFFTLYELVDQQPVIFKVKSWVQDASNNYTGCVAKAYRLNTLPANLTVITSLVNFSVTNGSVAGLQFSYVALLPST